MQAVLQRCLIEIGEDHPLSAHPHNLACVLNSFLVVPDVVRESDRYNEVEGAIAERESECGTAHVAKTGPGFLPLPCDIRAVAS